MEVTSDARMFADKALGHNKIMTHSPVAAAVVRAFEGL